jgi:hypothetical protein
LGVRVGLDDVEKRKMSCPCRELNFDRTVVQPIASPYTDCAILVLFFLIDSVFVLRHHNGKYVGHFCKYTLEHITNTLDFYNINIYDRNIEFYVVDADSVEKS